MTCLYADSRFKSCFFSRAEVARWTKIPVSWLARRTTDFRVGDRVYPGMGRQDEYGWSYSFDELLLALFAYGDHLLRQGKYLPEHAPAFVAAAAIPNRIYPRMKMQAWWPLGRDFGVYIAPEYDYGKPRLWTPNRWGPAVCYLADPILAGNETVESMAHWHCLPVAAVDRAVTFAKWERAAGGESAYLTQTAALMPRLPIYREDKTIQRSRREYQAKEAAEKWNRALTAGCDYAASVEGRCF